MKLVCLFVLLFVVSLLRSSREFARDVEESAGSYRTGNIIGENFFLNGFLTFQLSAWENYTT